jgi:hypothetical protein
MTAEQWKINALFPEIIIDRREELINYRIPVYHILIYHKPNQIFHNPQNGELIEAQCTMALDREEGTWHIGG